MHWPSATLGRKAGGAGGRSRIIFDNGGSISKSSPEVIFGPFRTSVGRYFDGSWKLSRNIRTVHFPSRRTRLGNVARLSLCETSEFCTLAILSRRNFGRCETGFESPG